MLRSDYCQFLVKGYEFSLEGFFFQKRETHKNQIQEEKSCRRHPKTQQKKKSIGKSGGSSKCVGGGGSGCWSRWMDVCVAR